MKIFNGLTLTLTACLLSNVALGSSPDLAKIPQQHQSTRFAIISDLTGGERAGIFDIAVEQLTALQPDFILSVGDLIDGGLEDTQQLNKQWQFFSQRINKTQIPFFPVVGNHDISNVVMRNWWQENIAPRYYHIRHKDMLFLMLDSEDYPDERFEEMAQIRLDGIAVYKNNPVEFPQTAYAKLFERKYGQIRQKQTNYFTQVLQENSDAKWTFVLMHKPMWKEANKTGFSSLEKALQTTNYTVFNGHTHTYQYTKRLGQDYIQLGTTGGAYTPADDGEYIDHIMWVSFPASTAKHANTSKRLTPNYLNLTLGGMLNKKGNIPKNSNKICKAGKTCSEVLQK